MDWLIVFLLVILLSCVIYIAYKLASQPKPTEIKSVIEDSIKDLGLKPLTQSDVKSAVESSITDLKIMDAVGSVKTIGETMMRAHQDLETMLKVKQKRSRFGEFQLEELLADSLPKDMFGIREEIRGLGIPDAHIKSVQGIICIDSKFPLDNYRNMIEARDESEKKRYKSVFQKDVRNRISEVKVYVHPEKGTVPFAFLFIPSEAVFYYLTEEESTLMVKAASENIYLTSPVMLQQSLNFIREGMWGERLTEKAKEVEEKLKTLNSKFGEFDSAWTTLKDTHLKRAWSKADDVDRAYRSLKNAYQRIAELEEE